jgi:hypothetical protein
VLLAISPVATVAASRQQEKALLALISSNPDHLPGRFL